MRPVGQMAFTNYLMQSILGGIIFYGIGFGLFGRLQRYELKKKNVENITPGELIVA